MIILPNKATELTEKLIAIFSTQPEVWKIETFGRLAEGIADDYSDVDLRIISKDPLLTQRNAHGLIEANIATIMATYALGSEKSGFAEEIILENYLPYHKIDLGIEREGTGIPFEPIVTVYENSAAAGLDRDCELRPIRRTVAHNLMDILFSAPRITKCFFRQDFDMYRRWKVQTNALLVLLNEKYTGWQEINQKKELGANEAKLLYQRLTAEDRRRLALVFPLDGELNIPASYLNMLEFYTDLATAKATALQAEINRQFLTFVLEFVRGEIANFERGQGDVTRA